MAGPYVLDPDFIDGASGRLFVMRWQPNGRLPLGEVLAIPPFAEEMNRSRRQFALAGQTLAAQGVAVTLLDLFGTGDSDGDFEDASVRTWIDDIRRTIAWLASASEAPLGVLGLRLGGLLALAALADDGLGPAIRDRVRDVVLWQPVASGEALLTQTLRIRLAAALGGGGAGETTGSLRQRLKAGETLEIAGYPIAPSFAASLDALRLAEPPKGTHTAWFEVGSEPRAEVSPGAMRAIERWRQTGHSVTQATVAAPPFWSLMETETAPALIEATLGFLGLKVPA